MPNENSIPDFEYEEDEEEKDDPVEFANTYEQLSKRCKDANIPIEERSFVEGEKYYVLSFPCGREKRAISVFNIESMKQLLEIPFEKYVFLGEYAAICSYSEGTIEAATRTIDTRYPRSRIADLFENQIVQKSEDGKAVSLGAMSNDLKALTRGITGRSFAVRIEGLHITQHDQAVQALEKITNSIFFQLDVTLDIALGLARQRRLFRREFRSLRKDYKSNLEFPKYEYDEAPMSLYWYARSAIGMPLLQFLAYYQSVEFYFPTYSEAEARRKIRNILKDPGFRRDRDADLGKILTAIRPSGGFGYGDERTQLRATLQECLNPDSLRSFFEERDDRKDFFSTKAKGLTDIKIPINNPSADLRNDVADRIYDIRCKIVHTKNIGLGDDVEILLPFSKEAEQLYFDIELLQFVSRQVIIAASTPLNS